MLNGFYIAHGGITYSLADSALAFASNAHNNKAVSVETNISHVKKWLPEIYLQPNVQKKIFPQDLEFTKWRSVIKR